MVGEFGPVVLPICRSEISTRHDTVRCTLDEDATISRDRTFSVDPLLQRLRLYAGKARKSCLPFYDLDRTLHGKLGGSRHRSKVMTVLTESRIRHYLLKSKALPYRVGNVPNKAMLTGEELGEALRIAIEKKAARWEAEGRGRLLKKDIAAHFGIQPPSLQDWIKFGRIGKQHLNELVRFFSDVVGPEHWGIGEAFTTSSQKTEPLAFTDANVPHEVKESYIVDLAKHLADQIIAATRTGLLTEQGLDLLEQNLRSYVGAATSKMKYEESGKLSQFSLPERKVRHGQRSHGRGNKE